MPTDPIIPVVAGLAVGIAFGVMFAILPVSRHPVFPDGSPYYEQLQDADYTPFLKLQITGLRDSYKAGESVDFAVSQTGGGRCALPELVKIVNLDTGATVREWNGTEQSAGILGCPFASNPAEEGMTWSTIGYEENPIIIDQAGSYAVVAEHLFKTAQKEFHVVAVSEGQSDTSPEVAAGLLSRSENLETAKALLEKYPGADSTVTANHHSKLFQEFQKYNPAGIVQYSVAKTDHERVLVLTLVFDRYYENNTPPLSIVRCAGENYSSLSVSELTAGLSEIMKC